MPSVVSPKSEGNVENPRKPPKSDPKFWGPPNYVENGGQKRGYFLAKWGSKSAESAKSAKTAENAENAKKCENTKVFTTFAFENCVMCPSSLSKSK